MSVLALETTHRYQPTNQKYLHGVRHEEVISSGYSSQEGDNILAVATSYLSSANPNVPPGSHQLQRQPSPTQLQHVRKISSSQVTQVSDYEGTISGGLQSPPNQLHTVKSMGEISRASSTMLSARKCMSPECTCCQRCEVLARINEELVQQKRQLEERNRGLVEEIQVSRRFYQGTLADLTAQLSIAENRIKYLKEVVSTQEEALLSRNQENDNVQRTTYPGLPNNTEHFTQPPSLTVFPNSGSRLTRSRMHSPVRTGVYYSGSESSRSAGTSSVASVSSESSRSRLNLKNLAKMKEQLLEKNQNLKTDIELLKFKTDVPRNASVPRSASVPSLNSSRSSQELPAIKSNRHEWSSTAHLASNKGEEQQLGDLSEERAVTKQQKFNIYAQSNHELLPEHKKKVKNRKER